MRSRSEASGEAGPQITISVCGRKAGAKKTRPWMWSRWRWVRRMWSRAGSASRARAGGSSRAAPTASPSRPRPVARGLRGPEDRDRPLRAVRGEDREGRDLDLVAGAVGGADAELGVGGAAIADGADQRQLVVGNRLAVLAEGAEQRSP